MLQIIITKYDELKKIIIKLNCLGGGKKERNIIFQLRDR